MYRRRQWHPTPVLLPGKCHGQRSLEAHGVAEGWTWLSDFTFTFHFHALEKEVVTHSSVSAWRIPGTGEPGRLPSMGSHRVGHNWSDLAAAVPYLESLCPCRGWTFSYFFPKSFIVLSFIFIVLSFIFRNIVHLEFIFCVELEIEVSSTTPMDSHLFSTNYGIDHRFPKGLLLCHLS